MKTKFTIRGLFLMMTFVSVLLAVGLWSSKSPFMAVIAFYFSVFLTILTSYLYVYRYQFRAARKAWKEHFSDQAELNARLGGNSQQDQIV